METLNYLSPLGVALTARVGNAICARLRHAGTGETRGRFPMAVRQLVERYGVPMAAQRVKEWSPGMTEQDATGYVNRVMSVKPGDDTVLPLTR